MKGLSPDALLHKVDDEMPILKLQKDPSKKVSLKHEAEEEEAIVVDP